jgi:site-specific DNA recombinase
VWHQIETVLGDPNRVAVEHERRIAAAQDGKVRGDLDAMDRQMVRLRRGIDRLIDSYTDEIIEVDELKPRLTGLKQRLAQLQSDRDATMAADEAERSVHLIIGRLADFAGRVRTSLDQLDRHRRREIIRALVRRIEIDRDQVEVVFRIPGMPTPPDGNGGPDHSHSQGHALANRQYCGRSYYPADRRGTAGAE